MDVVRRHRCHILHLTRSVGQSKDVGCEGAVGNVCDLGNARNRSDVAAVQVEATNSTGTVRSERAIQGGHAREGQPTGRCDMWSISKCGIPSVSSICYHRRRRVDKFRRRDHVNRYSRLKRVRSHNGFVIHSNRRCAAYGCAIFRLLHFRYSHSIK
ncbi:hypothetical protein Goari_011363 [Gossypium aridum]|uniref:Uncharacterized protein n=1 Tax=Gossypium aridum TaxID=34290 RepID=A0A7J8WXB8_GOSAI|nr:hypothetical protein [Gossypium aridum]